MCCCCCCCCCCVVLSICINPTFENNLLLLPLPFSFAFLLLLLFFLLFAVFPTQNTRAGPTVVFALQFIFENTFYLLYINNQAIHPVAFREEGPSFPPSQLIPLSILTFLPLICPASCEWMRSHILGGVLDTLYISLSYLSSSPCFSSSRQRGTLSNPKSRFGNSLEGW
jgi:hypothetical protein